MKTKFLLGFEIADIKLHLLDKYLLNIISQGRSSHICCINPHSYVVSKSDPLFKKALKKADFLAPDGIGIVVGLFATQLALVSRLTGFDLFHKILRLSNIHGFNVFFLGGDSATLEALKYRVSTEFPGIPIAGSYSPPFKEVLNDTDNEIINQQIRMSEPDIVFVSLSAPKQEKWVSENLAKHHSITFVSVGAVFDFYIGNIYRSPKLFRVCGLEWLPRLLQEPRRLYKRTFISAPIFLYDIIKYIVLRKI